VRSACSRGQPGWATCGDTRASNPLNDKKEMVKMCASSLLLSEETVPS
jgi:hypothetical protein